jgi:carbamoyl-phosphate synthase large subunit
LRQAKEYGFSDKYLASVLGAQEPDVRKHRQALGINAVYKTVDTCGAEFEATTPYLYSTYEGECEANPTTRRKVIILGGGPNRIGQGIEFDYCCVHAAFALREIGVESIMVNCNPETVSTDYDTSDRLYFEPLTFEDVMSIIGKEDPDGVIVQFGGQTPLKLAVPLEKAGVKITGTSPDSIDRAEDRKRFNKLVDKLKLLQPYSGTAKTYDQTLKVANKLGFPLLIRPSFVLGGRAMQIVYDEQELKASVQQAIEASGEHPILIDKFLDDATELDVDAISDGKRVVIGGIMEHIEEAGVHSGDSACSLPPVSLSKKLLAEVKRQAKLLQHPVRGQRRAGLCARSQPPGVADDSVREQVDWRASGQARRQGHGRDDLRRAGVHQRGAAESFFRQGSGVPVPEIPGHRHAARPRNALDRRGDGHLERLRHGVRKIANRRGQHPAHRRKRLFQHQG